MSNLRVGQGFDSHRFDSSRELFIGGYKIPDSKGLLGHSDADVLLHSIIDALLGALSLGDIGTLFPDTDSKYKNIDSKVLLAETLKLISSKSYSLVNVDNTLIAEIPKFKPYILEIRKVLSSLLKIDLENISVKATTAEKMGAIGREEGIACMSIVLLEKI